MVMEMVMMHGGWRPKLMLAYTSSGAEGATSMRERMIDAKTGGKQNEILLGLVPVGATTTHGSVPITRMCDVTMREVVSLGLVPAGATATQ